VLITNSEFVMYHLFILVVQLGILCFTFVMCLDFT